MTDRRGFLIAAIAFLALAVGTVALLSGQTVQLSPGPVKLTSPPSISADSQWAVWLDAQGIGSAPLHGGTPVRLLTLAADSQVFGPVTITPDSQRVVYVADQGTAGTPDLWSTPIGGGASVRLTDLHGIPGQVIEFAISPDSQRVYWTGDAAANNKVEFWRSPIGGGTATRINASVGSDYDVFDMAVSAQDRAVYRVGRTVQGGHELWSVPGSGRSTQARRISVSPMVTGGGVASDFQITGDRVVYRADASDNGRDDLYSVPIAGGVSTRIDRQDGRSVRKFILDGASAVYSYTNSEWYRVPVLGGASVAVAPPVTLPVTSPDGQYRVYEVGASLWAENLTTGLHRRISCLGQAVQATWLGRPTYSVTADSKTVVYVAGEVWASPMSGAVCEIFRDGFEAGSVGAWR